MGLQHKFGVAFFQLGLGLTILTPVISHALTLDPVNIDSSRGEPLYAEIPFRQAQSKKSINVSIAQPFESGEVAVLDEAKYAHYNFYVRQNADGNGVIVITSSRAINSDIIDLTLKIDDAGQTRIQQVRGSLPSRIDRLKNSLNDTVLKPRYVTNDQDLKLSLPEVSNLPEENQLRIASAAPPMMQKKSNTPEPSKNSTVASTPSLVSAPAQQVYRQPTVSTKATTSNTTATQSTPQPVRKDKSTTNATVPSPKGELNINVTRRDSSQPATKAEPVKVAKIATPVAQPAAKVTASSKPTAQPSEPKPIAEKAKTKTTTAKNVQNQSTSTTANSKEKHQVQANESLWGIANQISKQENIPISQVMKQIQENNKHAFINGNANQLKQGAILSLNYQYQVPTAKPQATAQVEKPKAMKSPAPQKAPTAAEKQSQAHMSIVAGDSKGSTQGTKAKGSDKKVANELTVRVKQQRESALGLQNNVRKLDRELVAKENRISLINARLAELEQQLKKRQATESKTVEKVKPNVTSSTTSKAIAPESLQYQTLSNIHQYKIVMQQGLV
ncbi:FimV/HubP family polar landmark protein [Acinetobacter sp.]|uniref:FimV/HubP family polar landmark protein n=1 Tax=Acinetobacter sp. TaxID=472 RepID=UPI0035AE6899